MVSAELIPYLLIAPLSAGIGWVTNLLGIKMMFYPANFVGYGRYLGWQGIIPRLRVRITRNLVNISVSKICTPKEVIKVLDKSDTLENIQQLIEPHIEEWIEEILKGEMPLWQKAPVGMKRVVFKEAKKLIPEVSRAIMADLSARADDLIDIADIAERQVRDRPELLNELFLRCANAELSFIIRSGLFFGFPLGCIQAIFWYLYPYNWVLPIFGILVGAGTNWIALKLITHPADPVFIGPFKIQGLYLRRQAAVSEQFAEIFTTNFMSPAAYIDYMWNGPKRTEVLGLVKSHLQAAFEQNMLSKMMKQMNSGNMDYASLEKKAVSYAAGRVTGVIDHPDTSRNLMRPIVDLIASQMKAMKPSEFQQLLLPAFDQDQYIVVIVGGLLGGLMGFAQLMWLFDAI
jgi:uncharacterized membrane protein YheB (UPF0754 family)